MDSSSRSASLISALLCLLLLAGCAKLTKSLGELSQLQNDIAKEFKEKEVAVNLSNGTSLTITFINSVLNSQEAEQRAQRAQRTAQFVSKRYPAIANIEAIWVVFMRIETRYVIVNYSENMGYFGFDQNAQPLREEAPPEVKPVDETRPAATYDPKLKQTDVVIRQMQLEGDINNGLSVIPHFTVPGDASDLKRSTSFPDSVRFDFSSFSEKSMFPGAPTFTFLADGKAVFETPEQFSTSKFGEQFTEFASVGVPYQTFRRIVGGKTLKLTIGDREYAFTEKQLDALREMTNYVKE
ncbi:MAG TPA: hypothetical protein VGO56_20560 [Pyrinomonadaceae bacterium]|jgi:hypothetical protein|nr:hypothetical protein [Pyrinomonadaceae bacterium]